MRILFSHTNYPAQFRRLVPSLVQEGHDVAFLAKSKEWHAQEPEGFQLHLYQTHRNGGSAAVHPYLRRFEQAVLEGQACYRAACALKQSAWEPDWIINHVGYGNGFFLGDVFPSARRIGLFEWYYNAFGSDVDFLTHGQVDEDRKLRLRTWNSQVLLELAACDHCVTPTNWQRQQFPEAFRDRLTVIHEGIDVDHLSSLRAQGLPPPVALPDDPKLEVLTYVSRCFEEYRGFPQVIRAIEQLQRSRPHLHVLIAGHDDVAYGARRLDGRTWGDWARHDCQLDPKRTHWLGMLQDQAYWQLLANSTVHLYLTVPFVLSWSLLEAMAAGCSIVASSTPPVVEVIQDGESGLLVDFFDVDRQVEAVERVLDDPGLRSRLAHSAQHQAKQYSAAQGLAGWRSLLGVTGC